MTFGNGSWTAIGPSECRTRFNRGFILSGQTASTLLGSLTIFARSCGDRVDSQESISCSKQQWRQLLGASRRNEPSYQLKEMVIFRVTRLGPFRRGLSNAPVCIRFRASISLGSPPVFPRSFYRMAGENSSDCSLTIAFRKELQNFLFADDPATIARLRTSNSCVSKGWKRNRHFPGSQCYAAALVTAPFRNVSRSALIVSASVVGIPWGKPL